MRNAGINLLVARLGKKRLVEALAVPTYETVISQYAGKELSIKRFAEDAFKALVRVTVEVSHVLHGSLISMIKGLVMNIVPHGFVTKPYVLAREQNLRMPEGIKRVRDRVLVSRIKNRDSMILAQGLDTTFEVLIRNILSTSQKLFTHLLLDALKVFLTNPGQGSPLSDAQTDANLTKHGR